MKGTGILKDVCFDVKPDEALNVYCILRRMQDELRHNLLITDGVQMSIPGYLDEPHVQQIFSVRMWVEEIPCGWWQRFRGRIAYQTKVRIALAQAQQ